MIARLLACLLPGVLLAVTLIAGGYGQAAEQGSSSQAPQKIAIVYTAGNPPLEFTDPNGKTAGLLIDFWRLWAQKTGVAIALKAATWDEALRMIREGEADLHAGLFYAEKRDGFLDYTAPLLDMEYFVFSHRTVLDVKTLEDLKGFRVGVPEGFTREFIAERLPQAALAIYPDFEQLYRAAHRSEVKVFVSPLVNYQYYLHHNGVEQQRSYDLHQPLYTRSYRGAVRAGNSGLLQLINQGLDRITPEERAAIERKWLGQARTDTRKVLTIAGSRNLPPLSMLNENGEPAGLGVDLWRLWAQKTGRQIQFRLTDISRSLADLKEGRADFHAGLFLSAERSEWLEFSAPYLRAPTTLYYLFGDGEPRSPKDFQTAKIGVQGPPPPELFQRLFPRAEPVSFENIPQMIEALERGTIETFIADRPSADLALIRSGLRGEIKALKQDLFQVELRAAVSKDGTALLAEIEKGLDAISRGELEAILGRWLGEVADYGVYLPRQDAADLDDEERAWIAHHPTLRIGVDPDYAPYEFVDEKGRYRGLSADFLNLLSRKLGLRFTRVPTHNWDETLRKGFAKEVDVLPLLERTPEREPHLLFTEPYFTSRQVIITRSKRDDIREEADLAGRTLALPAAYSTIEHIRDGFPSATISEVSDIPAALQRVAEGAVDATVLSIGAAGYWMDHGEITNLRIAAPFGRASALSMGCRNDWPALARILQKGLDAIDETERRRIRRRWISLADQPSGHLDLGLTPQEQAWLNRHPTITVGGDADWAPIDFTEEDGSYRGITAEYLSLLEKRLGIEFSVVTDLGWSDMLDQARARRLDMIASISRSEERAQYLSFTHPYFSVPYTIHSRHDDDRAARRPEELDGRIVAVEKDYSLHERLSLDYPAIRLLVVGSTREALEAVALERADAYIGNPAVAGWLIERNRLANLKAVATVSQLGRSEIRLGVRKDWPLLVSALNKGLVSISPEDHRRIRRRWLDYGRPGGTGSAPVLTESERDWLAAHRELRLGLDPAWEPIEFITAEGEYQGISSDFMKRLSVMLGIEMTHDPAPSWEAVMERVQAGEIDVLPVITPSPERARFLNFTKPYLHFPFMVFTRTDAPLITGIEDLGEARVAVERGYVTQEYLERDHPQLRLQLVDTTAHALRALAVGEVDAYIGNLTLGSYLIDKLSLGNLKVAAPTPYANDLAIGVRKDWPQLAVILDKALATIDENQRRAIRQESLAIRYDMGVDYSLVWRVVAAAAVLLLLTLLWLAQTRRQHAALARAKAEAEQANRFKSHFLANMSHEIRTPMNAIVGFAHLALQTELTSHQQQYIDKIKTSAHTLLGVINDVLDFSRIEAGKLEIDRTPFSLDAVLENLVDITAMRAEERGLELLSHRDLQIPDGLIGDPLRLGQVLINLVGNAIKFTEQGEVTLSVEQQARTGDQVQLRFTVADTGIGIAPEEIPRLLTAFSQLDGSTTRRHGGSGLGLSICRHLVQLMDGELKVRSTPGKGSRFSFSLSFVIQETAAERTWVPAPDLRGLRALVVDDNASARQILGNMLASFTFEVTAVASGQEALRLAQQADREQGRPYRLILIDWRMPQLDGVETGRRIKDGGTLSHIPAVILVSAYGREEVMHLAEEAGLDGMLIKPVSPSMLFDSITQALGGKARSKTALLPRVAPVQRLKGNLLLVEDNPINQQVAQELLMNIGLLVRTAGTGREALEALRRHPFDLVLMDVQMPEMDGYEATRRIRADAQFSELPVIALTAHAMSGEREKCLAAGMNDHIPKPIDPEALLKTLRHWLKPDRKTASAPASESPPASTVDVALPEHLPGIDLMRGLERVGGNRRLFRKLLSDFAVNHGHALQTLEEQLAEGDRDSARREVHTLQGVAGNIGARQLQQAARKLEKTLVDNRGGETQELPEEFCAAFNTVFDGLAALSAEENPVRAVGNETPEVDPATLLRRLKRLLEAGDPDAIQVAHQLDAALPDPNMRSSLQSLTNQVAGYDFERAQENLLALSGRLREIAHEREQAQDPGGG